MIIPVSFQGIMVSQWTAPDVKQMNSECGIPDSNKDKTVTLCIKIHRRQFNGCEKSSNGVDSWVHPGPLDGCWLLSNQEQGTRVVTMEFCPHVEQSEPLCAIYHKVFGG